MGKKLIESGISKVKDVLNKFKKGSSDANKELLENLTPDQIFLKEKKSREAKESKEISLQKTILAKPHMADHHRAWLEKRTDELVKNKNIMGLEQLKKSIDFAEGGRLVIHTHTKFGTLTFAPKQTTYRDVENIPGIENHDIHKRNVWTENKISGEPGLWADGHAVDHMIAAGKKICSDEQFMAAVNVLPGGNKFEKGTMSIKVEDFFDLLGVQQCGFINSFGAVIEKNRYLRSSSGATTHTFILKCNGEKSIFDTYPKFAAFGVWFLE